MSGDRIRRRVVLRGVTQGVGFRPTIYRFARGFAVSGFVRNDSDGVMIEVEGPAPDVGRFEAGLAGAIPPLARIDSRETVDIAPLGGTGFVIEHSSVARGGVPPIPADIATCPECVSELSDPKNRRFGYPFITCTLCGPRFTIVRSAPYDRERTSMAPFLMCPECESEYRDPQNRRFHSETNSCERCGPRLSLLDPSGAELSAGPAAIESTAQRIADGGIVAIKGIGGFHLSCDGRNAAAIAELRRRKRRSEKPFAVMVRDVADAKRLVILAKKDEALLSSAVSPIVIAPRSPECDLPESIAPGNPNLGIFAAYTPLHLLVFDALSTHASCLTPHALIMTSGNLSDEPIAIGNAEALERLGGIADAVLAHDREIVCRADDSILRRIGARAVVLRRARGVVPEGIRIGTAGPDALALGGEIKNTVSVLSGDFVHPSPHIGDLETPEAFDHFKVSIDMMQEFTACRPTVIACDMHPEYLSTKHAKVLAGADAGLRLVQVQHHHAHVAACMVEHGLSGPVIGVSFDGAGYGPDGTIWGGEFLTADFGGFRRVGMLKPVPMPGGEKAVREPFRMAAAFLSEAGISTPDRTVLENLGLSEAEFVTFASIGRAREFSPLTSSAGRLFDAVAAISGVARFSTFEGQAAMALEAAASKAVSREDSYLCRIDRIGGRIVADTPGIGAQVAGDVARHVPAEVIARKFHETLAAVVLAICIATRDSTGINDAVLSGGVFQNAIISELCENALRGAGFSVWCHQMIPPNDGGISVGQAVVAREVSRCASQYRCGF